MSGKSKMRNRLIVAALCVLGASTAVVAQQSPHSYVVKGHCEDGLPHFKEWFESTKLPHGQPYVVASQRKERTLENYRKLSLQMTLKEVQELLGAPDFSSPRASGHLSNDPHPPPTVCSDEVAYVFTKTSENMTDTTDEAIYLFFSPEGKLTWASPQNLPNLHELGGPQR